MTVEKNVLEENASLPSPLPTLISINNTLKLLISSVVVLIHFII